MPSSLPSAAACGTSIPRKLSLPRLIVAAGLTLAGVQAADAQPGSFRPLDVQGYEGTPVDALPTPFSNGGSCVRACQYDYSPCDPDYWKVADRRCNFNQRN